jgi:predicted glycosyltransferase
MMRDEVLAMREVREVLDSINQAWRTRSFKNLQQFFDDDIVVMGQD